MVERTKPEITPRPALAADDPRAVRYRATYEERMAAENGSVEDNTASRAAAQEAYDRAKAAHDVAQGNFEKAQEALLAAKNELSRAGAAVSKFGNPANRPLTPAETLSPGEDTTLMVFPKDVTLQANVVREDGTITGTRKATFLEGIQEVPVSLQNHQYLIDHNVMPYGGPRIERNAAPAPRVPAKEAKAA